MSVIVMKTSFQGLVVGLSAILSAIASTDDFRVDTVEKKGIGTTLNVPLEQSLEMKWDHVQDIRDALLTVPGIVMTRFDADISKAWEKLRDGHARKPWTSRFSGMERTARKMGVEQELAEAA